MQCHVWPTPRLCAPISAFNGSEQVHDSGPHFPRGSSGCYRATNRFWLPDGKSSDHGVIDASMEIKFECPACGQHLSATPPQIGVTAPCPNCSSAVTIPARQDD